MLIKLRFELDKRKFEEGFDTYIDRIHDAFRDEMLSELTTYPYPRDKTGLFRTSWQHQRKDKHHSEVSNSSPEAGYLQGTGIYGPRGQLICARTFPYMHFFWRAKGQWVKARCVRGIDPHNVHGYSMGDVYDFIYEMNTAIRKGWDNTRKAI